jgi:hypothetical protein
MIVKSRSIAILYYHLRVKWIPEGSSQEKNYSENSQAS